MNMKHPGKRERAARKRCLRRAETWSWSQGRWLKLGRKHLERYFMQSAFIVADAEKTGARRALESARRS